MLFNHLLYERSCTNQFWKDIENFWFLLYSKHIYHNHDISSNVIGTSATLFFISHSVQLKSHRQCNWTVGYNWTPVIRQLKLPITELITITIATITYPKKKKLVNFQDGRIFLKTISLPLMFVLIIHTYIHTYLLH